MLLMDLDLGGDLKGPSTFEVLDLGPNLSGISLCTLHV